MKKRRGIALMTALLFIVFLLIVGIAFLTMVEQDYSFGKQQQHRQQAFFLAQSGMDYYKLRSSSFAPNTPQQFGLPLGDPDNRFEVVVLSDGTIRSRGWVENKGKVLAERTLVVPAGNFAAMYDETQK